MCVCVWVMFFFNCLGDENNVVILGSVEGGREVRRREEGGMEKKNLNGL